MAPRFRFVLTQHRAEKDVYQTGDLSADEFIRNMLQIGHSASPDKDGPGIIAATFQGTGRLEGKNVATVTGLILDVDSKTHPVDPESVFAALPFRGVAHTSYSHSTEVPKFRVIFPLQEELTPEQFRRLWWWAFEKTGRSIDPAPKDPSRMFYLPRCPAEMKPAAWMRELKGPFLSYRDVSADFQIPDGRGYDPARLARTKKQGAHFAAADTKYPKTDGHALLQSFMTLPAVAWAMENPAQVSREVWRGIATNLGAIVVDNENLYDDCSAAFHEISAKDTGRYSFRDCEWVFKNAVQSARTHGPMTYAHMVANGLPPECTGSQKTAIAQARSHVKPPEPPTPTPPPTKPKGPPASSPPSSPSPPPDYSDGEGDGEGEEGDPTDPVDPERFLFDARKSSTGYLYRDDSGEWSDLISEVGLAQLLKSKGYAKKAIEAFKANVRSFMNSRAVFNRPNEYFVIDNGVPTFNTYRPSKLIPVPGTWDDIRLLLLNLVGGDTAGLDYLLDWLALPIQQLFNHGHSYKMGTSVVFHGDQGSGKGTLSAIISAIYGTTNVTILNQSALDSNFNGFLVDKLFVVANEVMSSTNRSAETANKIKPWITDHEIVLEQKFKDTKTYQNHFNIIFTSNDERPVIVEKSDRRFVVFNSKKLDVSLAERIYDDMNNGRYEVAAFLHHLLTRVVKIKRGQLYETVARKEMIRASLTSADKFIEEMISDGYLSLSATWVEAAPQHIPREATFEGNLVLSETLFEVYRDFCRRHRLFQQSQTKLVTVLRDKVPAVDTKRVRFGGAQRRAYVNVPMHPEGAEVLPFPAPIEEAPAKAASIDDGDFGV